LIQRCQVHKRRNVLDQLPDEYQPGIERKLIAAYAMTGEADARRALDQIHRELERINPSAARSLEEGMEETLTVHKLPANELRLTPAGSINRVLCQQGRRSVLVGEDVGECEREPEESKHEDPELVHFAVIDFPGNSEGATGTAHRTGELQRGRTVDLEINNELPGLDILLQRTLEGRRDGLAPRPRAVVGTIWVSLGAALIDGERPRCMLERFHRACEEKTRATRLHVVLGQDHRRPRLVRDLHSARNGERSAQGILAR